MESAEFLGLDPYPTTSNMIRNLILAGVASLALATTGFADQVGKPLPNVEFEGIVQSQTEEFADFTGRLVLIEFFAYW